MTRDLLFGIGECMVEMSPADEDRYRLGFAGDTFNTCWYLRRELPQATVAYLSAVGTDKMSDRMLDFMRTGGVDTSHVARLPDATVGLYLIDLARSERSFSYWRSDSAARRLANDAKHLTASLARARLAYFSGITMAILPPKGRRALLGALKKARADGCLVAFDPNLRPALWGDASEMRSEITRAAEVADIILPSYDDEKSGFGDATPQDSVARYAKLGAPIVVLKNGASRIYARAHGVDHQMAVPFAERVVDTTAAGDSFNAGFLAAHLLGRDVLSAMSAGARLSGRVIGSRGALVN